MVDRDSNTPPWEIDLPQLGSCDEDIYRQQVEHLKKWAANADAELRASKELRNDVLTRLARWASANKREREQFKSPTYLNPYTVALWLGAEEKDFQSCILNQQAAK